ncbi:unnamed protein product [Caenorhabditis sp. 36 PRJEB53466]|nr:unnamed protein product [Caenorhabditis sp. 36 PRJEB53466]
MKLILVLFVILASVDASAKLLVAKNSITKYQIAYQENIFEYHIINVGNSPAINVELDDRSSFPTDRFDVLKGSLHFKYASIAPNTTALHYVMIVPLTPQPMEDKDVTVDYTDSESGETLRMTAVSFKRGSQYYFPEHKLYSRIGINSKHFVGFAFLALPVTLLSALFYHKSTTRYAATISHKLRRQ